MSEPVGPGGEGLVIVTEQVSEFGGVERIVETLVTRFPEARLVAGDFAAYPGFPPGDFSARVRDRGAALPEVELIGPAGARRRHFFTPLYAQRARSVSLGAANVVLSLGGTGWTLAPEVPAGARHVGYIGGPPRAYWGHTSQYLREYRSVVRPLLRASVPALRAQYRGFLRRPHALATNSAASARAIEEVIGLRPPVVYPPTRTSFFTPGGSHGDHYLVVARLRAHKRVDVIVDAFRRLGRPLIVAGEGPWRERLTTTAPANVTFVGHLPDHELRELYRSSRGLVSASIEEFGLCLTEAQACGIPVLAPNAGGATEIVVPGETGVLFDRVDADSVAEAVRKLDELEIDPGVCRDYALRFSEERFVAELEAMLAVEIAKLAS